MNEDLPGSKALSDAINQGWLKVEPCKNNALIQLLRRDLDPGEAAAIALAVDKQADLILLDEREGRRIAQTLNLKVTGILGVAMKACKSGELQSMPTFIQALRSQAGFHISSHLEQQILAAIND